jgi:hypothetical protein
LKSTAPRSLKPKALTVLGFVNLAYTKLSAVGWNLAALGGQPQTVAALQSASTRAQPAIDALDGYYRKTCKFRI